MALSDYFLHHRDVIPVSPAGRAKQRSRARARCGVWLMRWSRRDCNRSTAQIARYLEGTGGKFTDTVEREIEERLYPHRRDRLF